MQFFQRTAERLVGIGASLKPLFASSLGFGQGANYKRETGQDDDVKFGEGVDPADEASEDSDVKADAPSQFKRSPTESEKQEEEESKDEVEEEIEEEKIDDSNRQAKSAEEEKKALASSLAKQVIEKILENRAQEADSAKAPENQNFENGESGKNLKNLGNTQNFGNLENVESYSAPNKRDVDINPYYIQQYRNYNPHVKRQAPQYIPYSNNFENYYSVQPYRTQYNQYTGMYPYAYSG